ncbi:hypothetical protein BGZ98_000141 [Dissophora globulifera]|nr:hypothetical protein BGZ98_000141 [Dissophora globulifera]
MALIEEMKETPVTPGVAPGNMENITFLGLTREQCHILLALYHVTDPSLEPQVPLLYPEMARKFAEDRRERNSLANKLARAPEKYAQEVLNLQAIQKAVAEALLKSDMDTEKARGYLNMKPLSTPKEELTIQEVLSNGFLMGGVRSDGSSSKDQQESGGIDKKASPLSAPGFREAKAFYDYAFEKFDFSMAAVQLGTFYAQEFKDCQGANCIEGEDPEQISIDYFLKAAAVGNPMAMHKAGWHYDQRGKWHEAIKWYKLAADLGYPDSAHNLGMIYQEGNPNVQPRLEVDLDAAAEYYERGLGYGYGASGTQLGRLFFTLATDKSFRDKLPESSALQTNDPREYMAQAVANFNKANLHVEVESLQFLGMIYGSKDFGLYNLDSSQNLFELALIASNGAQQPFEFLCRTLSAKRALIAEDIARQERANGSVSAPQKVDADGLKSCAAQGCGNKEFKKDQFQRCAGCKKRYFCSRVCQVNDWKNGHKKSCQK